MGNTANSDKIGQPAKQIHAGINYVVASASLTATASGTETINLIHLPRGAKIQNVFCTTDVDGGGTGAESVIIETGTTGRRYLSATWAACNVGAAMGATTMHANLGYVLTASETLILKTNAVAGTGTASMSIKVGVSYTVEDDQL